MTSTTRRFVPEDWYKGCPEITSVMRAEVKAMCKELWRDQQSAHRRLVNQTLKSNVPLVRLQAIEASNAEQPVRN